jgi:hypothetical protein
MTHCAHLLMRGKSHSRLLFGAWCVRRCVWRNVVPDEPLNSGLPSDDRRTRDEGTVSDAAPRRDQLLNEAGPWSCQTEGDAAFAAEPVVR